MSTKSGIVIVDDKALFCLCQDRFIIWTQEKNVGMQTRIYNRRFDAGNELLEWQPHPWEGFR
jgi:hypothetical protein